MLSRRRAAAGRTAAVALLILAAMACRRIGLAGRLRLTTGYLRSFIYIGLLAVWGLSVRRRVVQTQVRRYLTAIAALMVFWLAVRTVKYFAACGPDVGRQLWYLYYLPMLFIPLLAVYVAFSLGRPERFRLRPWTSLLYLPAAALLLLVLTNDLHRLVFVFPSGPSAGWEGRYGYAVGYWLTLGWMALCGLTALVVMLAKCRVPRSRTVLWLPIVPMILAALYAAAMVCRMPAVYFLMGDVTVSLCLFFASFFECCIRCGLIQSNTHYGELFRASTIRAQIADSAYAVRYSSDAAQTIPPERMRQAERAPVLLDGGFRLFSAPIAGGHVLWQDDVSGLLAVQARLTEIGAELERSNGLLREEYRREARRLEVEEANRLYDAMERQTAPQMRLVSDLLRALPGTRDEGEARKLLCRIAVVGAYLKRRNNLIFVAGQQKRISAGELAGCLNESARGIALGGGRCLVRCETAAYLEPACAMRLYDFFEAVAEAAGPAASFFVTVGTEGAAHTIAVSARCAADLSAVGRAFPGAAAERDEDDVWNLTLCVREGSGA